MAVGLEDSSFGVNQRSGGLKKSPPASTTILDPARLGFLGILTASVLGHGIRAVEADSWEKKMKRRCRTALMRCRSFGTGLAGSINV